MSADATLEARLARAASAARIRDGALRGSDEAMRAQVCVVGTGAGGATVAYELARRGHSVVVLEEGAYRTGREMSGDPDAMRRLLYRAGGALRTADPHEVALALGRTVGGTTAIQYGTAQRAPDDVLRAWDAEHGVPGFGPGDLRPRFERAERELGVAPVPEEHVARGNALLERGAGALGYAGARLARAARGCIGTGVCALGCPQDAAVGMHATYVPAALGQGAVLYVRTRAERLLLADGRAYGVTACFLDEGDRPTGRKLRVVADRVVVAAGALATPVFLQRSGVAGGEHLGRNLRVQPVARVAARFPDEVRGWEGVPQAYEVSELSADGIRVQGQFLPPALAAAALPGVGGAHADALSRFAHLAWCDVLVADGSSSGTVAAARDGSPIVRYHASETDRRRMIRGIALAAEVLLAAGAEAVFPPLLSHRVVRTPEEAASLREADVADGELRYAALHPMGTARMAEDPQRGVTSATGEVHGTRDLHVVDASLLPAPLGVQPALTIVALALQIAEHLSGEIGAPL